MDIAYAYLSGCVFIPVFAAFVLKKFSYKAGLISLASSSVALTGMFFVYGISSNYPIIIGMVVGLVSYLVTNIFKQGNTIWSHVLFSLNENPFIIFIFKVSFLIKYYIIRWKLTIEEVKHWVRIIKPVVSIFPNR